MKPASIVMTLAVALPLAVAACAGDDSGVVYNSYSNIAYVPRSLSAAMSRAPLLVETYGTPAGGADQQSVSRATALALRQYGPPWLPRNYTDSAADAGTGPYRLRIAYGLPRAFDRQHICAATMDATAIEAARAAGEPTSSRTVAILCRGEKSLSVAEGSPGDAAEIGGERFSRFLGLIGREVMPRRNPEMDDCVFRFCE